MGFSFGKSSKTGISGQTSTQRHASNILFESLIPGSSMTGGYVSDKTPTGGTPAAKTTPGTLDKHGQPIQGDGTPELSTRTPELLGGDPIEQTVSRQMGNYVPSARNEGFGPLMGHGMTEAMKQQIGPYTDVQGQGRVASTTPLTQGQTDMVTKTLLPSLEDMRYKGTFERFDKGDLAPSAAKVVEAGVGIAGSPIEQAQAIGAQIDQTILEGNIPQLPELPAVTDYINDVYTNMPDPMKNVLTDLMSGGTTANIQSALDKNVQAMTTQAQTALTAQLEDTYGRFAASGVSGGAMLAAAGDVTTRVMADVSAKIANFYQQALTQMSQERQIAQQTVSSIVDTAQKQQSMDLQRDTINLESQLKIIEQKYNMYTSLTKQFLDHNLGYMNIIAQEIDRENTEQINSMRMFYEVLVSLATGGPALSTQRSKSTQFGVDTGVGFDVMDILKPKDPDT
mgnify:CR=1 FL=1